MFELLVLEEAREFLKSLSQAQTLVVATHGIVKKTQKTPAKEINKADSIQKKYFEDKQKINKR